ncbi:MAG TPA: NAD(P)-dependent oxidoreductase [Acidothermaceae bacterium]|jgi:nucleoside-diphosphate-sugar epimerase|nr:NAD(P)-dependent oxidoreductase [Acidothermaceae bacterium]
MRVFLAGASGAIGRRLVPLLVSTGHQVVGTTTTPSKLDELQRLGAEPVQLDLLDAVATKRAVADAKPDVIVHQATALAKLGKNSRNLSKAFAVTNQLRTVGTHNLLDAAWDVGVSRFIAQGFCGLAFARAEQIDGDISSGMRAGRDAMRSLEETVADIGGVILSYGGFYGPGTSLGRDGEQTAMVRRRLLPMIGTGDTIFQFLHIDDAATATLAALTRGEGHYDIVDDEPAALSEWVPAMAAILGAKPPRHMPMWLAKLVAGDGAALFTIEAPASSNVRAKADLSWKPAYPSWREGFAHELG